MPMKITIRIRGLAVCYKQGNFWQVVFICDNWHKVKFNHTKNGGTMANKELRKIGVETRTVTFSFHNVGNAPSPSDPMGHLGSDFSEILNMTDDRLHGKHPNGKAKVKRKRDSGTQLIFMLIPDIALRSFGQTNHSYYGQLDTNNSQPFEIGFVSNQVGAEITLNSGTVQGGSMLFDDGEDNVSFPYNEGDKHTLIFDNDCGTSCKANDNDFRMFYKWLKDNTNEAKKFIAGKITTSLSEFKDREDFEAAVTKELKSPLHGNCDPIVVEPPPEP